MTPARPVSNCPDTFYARRGKRVLDVVGSGVGLLLVWPLLGAVAIAVRVALGRPVLFRQRRPGRGGAPFTIVKFRTMTDDRGGAGRPRADAERLTRFGRFLRSTSLDELPELLNVLRGDMSLVGPRPLLMAYLPRYDARQARRHAVRPGMTGLAQVSGRNALSWERRLELDVAYVERCSFALDLWILVQSVVRVLRREGIAQPGHATTEEFRGTT
jgi:lipopolysaccharide/colanic/teichoic acid biosynthesis glycosyltransferase